jgi:hypothetical protein
MLRRRNNQLPNIPHARKNRQKLRHDSGPTLLLTDFDWQVAPNPMYYELGRSEFHFEITR